MNKKWVVILLSISTVMMGFFRDYIFSNINWIYKTLTENRMNQARKEFHFMLEWNPDSIMTLKWILTVVFYGIFLGLTLITINFAFRNKRFNLTTLAVFGALFSVSGVLYALGWMTNSLDVLYGSIRTLMGMAQSFIPLMILGVIFKFIPETQRQ